jgi:hypothetical protein
MASSIVAVLALVLTLGADVPDGVANNERDELTGTTAPSLLLRQRCFIDQATMWQRSQTTATQLLG